MFLDELTFTGRVAYAYLEWRVGRRRYGFPRCCCAHYAIDVIRGRYPAIQRGGVHDIHDSNKDAYVPCGICIRRPSRWRGSGQMRHAPHSR